jgi:hypothetical protein
VILYKSAHDYFCSTNLNLLYSLVQNY